MFSEYCRKTFLFLACAVATVGSIFYCFYLIWLLADLKDSGYYWSFAAIPVMYGLGFVTSYLIGEWKFVVIGVSFGVLLTLMCSFTMFTRQAYYHLSEDADRIGPRLVIMSLKGSIVFFVCGFLTEKECRLQKILEKKAILILGLLDFVDIFDMVELLSLDQCVGVGSCVTEGSSLEIAIQAFCTMSFLIVFCIYEEGNSDRNEDKSKEVLFIYVISLLLQDIPFLIIRIIVWAKYSVISLDFMVKNILAIVFCCAGIKRWWNSIPDVDQNEEPNNANVPEQHNNNVTTETAA